MGWPEAMSDAASLIRRNDLSGNPQIVISDDGILTIEWHRGDHGVVLLFAGDESVAISFRSPGIGYAENEMRVSVHNTLPSAFSEALMQITELKST